MGPDTLHVIDLGIGDAGPIEAPDHGVEVQRSEGLDDQPAQRIAIGYAFEVGAEALVCGQLWLLQHLFAEQLPLALVLQPQHDGAAVADREGAIRVDGRMRRARTWWWCGALVGVVERVVHPFHQRLEHRHFHLAADAGFLAQEYRREDAGVGIHASGDVCDRVTGLGHPVFARPTSDRQKAALALDQQVVGLFLFVRAACAVAGDIADNQPGEARVQRLEGQPQARSCTRCQVLHKHISLLQQLIKDVAGDLLLEVQGQAFFGTVGPHEMRGQAVDTLIVAPGEIATARALHLDDPGAQVG
ncbi:hypothetical protein D3C78_1099220 [compost metagenome]